MGGVLLAGEPGPFLRELATVMDRGVGNRLSVRERPPGEGSGPVHWEAAVYAAARGSARSLGPELEHARRFFQQWAAAGVPHVIVISSAAVHEPNAHHPGMVSSTRRPSRRTGSPIARHWRLFETAARRELKGIQCLTILRPVTVLYRDGRDYFNRLFRSRLAMVCPGFDPPLQLIGMEQLGVVVEAALESRSEGVEIRHVAPTRTVPLQTALALSQTVPASLPRTLQRVVRRVPFTGGRLFPIECLDYSRYSWTVQDESPPGSAPRCSSARELWTWLGHPPQSPVSPGLDSEFDDFGMDRGFIDRLGGHLFQFLHDTYWRVELEGVEEIPKRGGAVLVGLHRGFMPFDAIMVLHEMARLRGRYPRFLIHPGLVKFPFFFNFITRLGGVLACRENADRLLGEGEIVGVFPEGVWGAFSMYRDAYRFQKFVSDEFVRLALRHRVPILPFVTVGSAETFPIIARIDSVWWKRYAEWPFFPITPTFPWLPVPLPSKWRTRYLSPVPVHQEYPPGTAEKPAAVRAISERIRSLMQHALTEILERRRSWFW